ncbi:MAG: LysR family transcriptional regulator [Pseudomonadota bacterium]
MSNRNIRNLPLLEAFEAILTRGSIIGAAEAMNVTQSAVSKQLSQLRGWLDDELFVRTSEGMQPTPRALELRDGIHVILEQANNLTTEDVTPPKEFTGKFVLSATDDILTRLSSSLVTRISEKAPQLRLVTLPLRKDYYVRQLEAGQVNLVVAINWQAPDLLKQKRLGSDHFVCVMHQDHALAKRNMTLKRYVEATHVLAAPLGNEKGVVDLELEKLNLERRVCASVSAFNMIDDELLGTSRIATVPSRVAKNLARKYPYVTKRVPIGLPKSHYYALWHPRFSADSRLRWMLDCVSELFDSRD